MKKTLLSAASSIGIVTAALLFTGCGDSDSSSSSSTAGTQTGQFVKGPWKGIGYTRSNGVSGTTGVNGTFTYNLGENVTFDFGLGTAKWVSGSTTGNSTNPASAFIVNCINPKTNTTWGLGNAAKVAAIFGAYSISENSTDDLASFVSALKTKVAAYNASLDIANNITALDTIVAGIGSVNGITANGTYATSEYDATKTKLANTIAAIVTANLPSGYSLNMTDKVVVLTDGVYNGSYHRAINTTSNTSFTDQWGNNWTALGKMTSGVSMIASGGDNIYTAKVVAYNMSFMNHLVNAQNLSLSVDGKNKTYSFGINGTYNLTVDGSVVPNGNGTWNLTTDMLGINLFPTDRTVSGANSTVTFEDAPFKSGVVAQIWDSVANAFDSVINSIKSTISSILGSTFATAI